MEHEPVFVIGGGIGRSSATSYPEFATFSPENYGHNMMGFHHHQPQDTTCGLPHEIQHPVGAVVPTSTTTGLFAADNMGIPHQETSSVVDMAGLTQQGWNSVVGGPADLEIAHLKYGSTVEVNAELPHLSVGVGDAESPTATDTESLLVENPRGHLYLQEVNVVGLPQPGPYPATGVVAGSTTATAMETPDSGNALLREFNMREVNAGLTPTAAGKEILPVENEERKAADSLVVNAGGGLPAEPDPYSVDVDVLYTATDKEIIDMVRAKDEEHDRHGMKVIHHMLAEKDPTELQEAVCYFTNQRIFERKTHHGEWKEKHREVVYADGVKRRSPWSILLPSQVIGLKITLEFHIVDGSKTKKTDWLMHEYIPIHNYLGASLYYWSQKLVLQKVFKKNDKQLSQSIGNNAQDGYWVDINDELNRTKTAAGKRRKLVNVCAKAPNEPSKVWQDFIKIYDKRPDPGAGAKLLYAACRYCHIVLKADNGTKSLLSHCTSCPCKKDLQPSSS